MGDKRILVAHERCRPNHVIREINDEYDWHWIYAGRDFLRLLKWQRALQETACRHSIGVELQRAADELAGDFNALIDELGKRHSSVGWWIGQIAEKNTFISHLFLYICYLKSIIEEINLSQQINWLVVTDSPGLARALGYHARSYGWRFGWALRWQAKAIIALRFVTNIFVEIRSKISMTALFVSMSCLLRRWDVQTDDAGDDRKRILIHSWVRNDSLSAEGKFVDRFFDELPDQLQKRGYKVQYMVLPPTLISARRVWIPVLESLRDQGMLLPTDRYLRTVDLVKALLLPYMISNVPHGQTWLGRWNVSALISEERWSQICSSRTSNVFLFYLFARRLGMKGKSFDRIIHTFENHNWEKAFCFGIHENRVSECVVGFQHTSLLWNYHVYSPGEFEHKSKVLPDVVVANGAFWADKLMEKDFPHVVIGGAYRFKHLLTVKKTHKLASKKPVILAAASASASQTLEMLQYLNVAFGNDGSNEVWIKLHPLFALSPYISQQVFEGDLPSHFRFVDDAVSTLLSRSDVLIYCSTTMCFEALAHGVPAVSVVPETSIDLDVMRWFPHMRRAADSPHMLREEIKSLLAMSMEEKKKWYKEAKVLVDKVFEPISPKTADSFLV